MIVAFNTVTGVIAIVIMVFIGYVFGRAHEREIQKLREEKRRVDTK